MTAMGLVDSALSVSSPAGLIAVPPHPPHGGDKPSRALSRFTLYSDGVAVLQPVPPPDPFRTFPAFRRSPQRRYSVRRRLVRAACFFLLESAGTAGSVYFLTLTFPSCLSEHERYDRVRRFARFLAERKARGIIWGYVYVLERHKSGAVHAHFLIAQPKGVRLWSTSLVQASIRWTGSPNGLDKRIVRSRKQIASYLAKYVSKSSAVTFSMRAYAYSFPKSAFRRVCYLPIATDSVRVVFVRSTYLPCDFAGFCALFGLSPPGEAPSSFWLAAAYATCYGFSSLS